MRWLQILVLGFLSYTAFKYISHRAVKHPDGMITAANDPDQSSTSDSDFTYKRYEIKPLKDFKIVARVLSAEHYSVDAGADLVPVDLALGWGRMSETAVINQLNISQSGRFYRYSYKLPAPIPPYEIVTHSANMHMIPSTDLIAKQLNNVRVGQIVNLSGNLVEAKDLKNQWTWRSSLTREDSGGGACELIWVKSLYVSDL
ncbi:MAG: hypothetical protein H7Z73_11125 [Candidatus Saccharibacteria bacterium]|nr:hypothetical protein [Moraxellaceae bacterium]